MYPLPSYLTLSRLNIFEVYILITYTMLADREKIVRTNNDVLEYYNTYDLKTWKL